MRAGRVLHGPWAPEPPIAADAEHAGEHLRRLRRDALTLLEQASEVLELYIETERDIQQTLDALTEGGF